MIEKAEKKDSGWSRDYAVGKWTVTYLKTLEEKNAPEDQLEEICKKYWNNSGVRRYYIDRYFEKKNMIVCFRYWMKASNWTKRIEVRF